MRSCCEKTLGVLRENKESLITIIEVKPCDLNACVCVSAMATTETSFVCYHGHTASAVDFRTDSTSCCIA